MKGTKFLPCICEKGICGLTDTRSPLQIFSTWWNDVANNPKLSKSRPPKTNDGETSKPPKVEIVDEHTIRYSWESVNPLFLTALAGARPMYIYMPSHYLKQFHAKYADEAEIASLVESEKVQNWTSLHRRFGRQYRPENPPHADPAGMDEHNPTSL